jgi:Trypsin/Low-density lipoprotein receptor domain class A
MKCAFCPLGSIYCGRGRFCVARTSRCDGKFDCPDGSDEKDCLSIAPHVSYLNVPKPMIPHRNSFYSEGFAVFSERGITGKLCSEGMDNNGFVKNTVSESLCKALSYGKVTMAEVRNDTEPDNNYVRVLDPKASEISFVRTNCSTRQALYLRCADLQCGLQSALSQQSESSLSKMAQPGDWPWHCSLFRKDSHVCDGVLVSEQWILTTESCFQGQPKATWLAVFGSVRLNSHAPWQQRRRIVGMVRSPVEGSTAAMVRLETPVTFTDFVRPICLPEDGKMMHQPQAERFFQTYDKRVKKKIIKENRQYFEYPSEVQDESLLNIEYQNREYSLNSLELTDNQNLPKAEAVSYAIDMDNRNVPQIVNVPKPILYASIPNNPAEFYNWINCNYFIYIK